MLKFKSNTGTINLLDILSIKKGKFIGIESYKNSRNEVSNYLINGATEYKTLLVKSLDELDKYKGKYPEEIIYSVREEIAKSLASPQKFNYDKIGSGIGHKNGTLYIWGSVVNKKILVKSDKPERQYRKEETRLKDELRSRLPIGKFRIFKLNENFEKISFDGQTLG